MHLVSDDQPGPCDHVCACTGGGGEIVLSGEPDEETLAAGENHQLSRFKIDGRTVYDVLSVAEGATVGELIETLQALEPDGVVTAIDTDDERGRAWLEVTPKRELGAVFALVTGMMLALSLLRPPTMTLAGPTHPRRLAPMVSYSAPRRAI